MTETTVNMASPTGGHDARQLTGTGNPLRPTMAIGDPVSRSLVAGVTADGLQVTTARVPTYHVARGPVSGTAPVAPNAPAAVANTDKILLQAHHLATSTKTVKIRRIWVSALLGTAVTYLYSVYRTSATAPTGGTPVASFPAVVGDPASECTWQYQNTTAIATALLDGSLVDVAQISAVGGHNVVVLYDFGEMGKTKPLTMRAGVAEGFAVCSRTTTATAPDAVIQVEYTEE